MLDVENALITQDADLIQVGGHSSDTQSCAGKTSSPRDLINSGNNYFRDCSFLPSTIYRTSFAQKNISQCYAYSYFMYPHMAMVIAAYREQARIYVSKELLVTPSMGTQGYSQNNQFEWWFGLSEAAGNSSIRNQMLTSQWVCPLDESGLYGLLNTAVRVEKYLCAIKIVIFFRFNVIGSISRMIVRRLTRYLSLSNR